MSASTNEQTADSDLICGRSAPHRQELFYSDDATPEWRCEVCGWELDEDGSELDEALPLVPAGWVDTLIARREESLARIEASATLREIRVLLESAK